MPVTDIISHTGDVSNAVLTTDQVRTNLYGLDTGSLGYFSSDPDALVVGQNDPTYPGLLIEELQRTRDGEIYDFVATVSGIKGAKTERQLKGEAGYSRTLNPWDWDTYQTAWITTNRRKFVAGQPGTEGTTVCVSVTDEHLQGPWYKVTGRFTGIIDTKREERTVTCGNQQISGESIRVDLPGGGTTWNDFRKAEVNLPRIIVVRRLKTTTPPPSQLVPGVLAPPNPPVIKVINASGDNLTSHWPNGWNFTFDSKQLGTGLFDITFTHEYVYFRTP